MKRSAETMRVLHVDDDRDFADTTSAFLERVDSRIAVQTAASASEGLTQLTDGAVDCIVSDYEMPERDGIEFLELVRETHPDIPFILFTGKGSEEIASEAISAGVTDYLRKRSGTEQYELLATRIETAVGQYRAERELERQNDLFRKTQELASVGGWEWYPQKEDGYYSEEVYDIYGVETRSDSTPEIDIEEFYHPDDRERIRTAFERAIETGEPYDIELRLITADGTEKWVRTRGDPEFEDGTCVRISGTIQDITAHKETEDRLAAYVEDISDVLGIISQDGSITDLSASVERVFGYDRDELHGEVIFEYIHPEDRERVQAELGELVGSETTASKRVEYRFRQADGSWKWVESIGNNRTTAPGGYVVTTRDITDRKSREQELERTRDLLTKTEHMAECNSDHLDAVEAAHERMETPIEDLLTLAREGDTVDHRERVEITPIARECWETVETTEATIVADSDRTVQADRSRLKHVFENLFRNSVEHCGTGVTVTVGDLPNGFYIEDDGPGVPDGSGNDVFETGYSTSETGTDFGLSIVRQIIGAHGWEIQMVEGDTGGARFEITGVEFEQ